MNSSKKTESRTGQEERGRTWLCAACGRVGVSRDRVGDESCFLNAVEVYADSIERDSEGRLLTAEAVDKSTRRRRKFPPVDTKMSQPFSHFLSVARDEGFEIVLDEPIVNGDYQDRMVVLWKAAEGLLLHAESYYGGSSTNKAYVYFNLHTSTPPPNSTGGLEDDDTFVGFLDCREDMRRKLSEMRERGAFMSRWRHTQDLYLWNYVESRTYACGSPAVDAAKVSRAAKLPYEVRQAVKLERT